jgi:hypothetical protein
MSSTYQTWDQIIDWYFVVSGGFEFKSEINSPSPTDKIQLKVHSAWDWFHDWHTSYSQVVSIKEKDPSFCATCS